MAAKGAISRVGFVLALEISRARKSSAPFEIPSLPNPDLGTHAPSFAAYFHGEASKLPTIHRPGTGN